MGRRFGNTKLIEALEAFTSTLAELDTTRESRDICAHESQSDPPPGIPAASRVPSPLLSLARVEGVVYVSPDDNDVDNGESEDNSSEDESVYLSAESESDSFLESNPNIDLLA
jgi:hypothetical protein